MWASGADLDRSETEERGSDGARGGRAGHGRGRPVAGGRDGGSLRDAGGEDVMDHPWTRTAEPGRRLEGRTALVTGAGCTREHMGIGGAISILFASQGAHVGLLDVSKERAETTRALVEEVGGQATVTVGDITDPDDNARCVNEVAQQLGPPDVLVNSAAIVAGGGNPVGLDLGGW